MGLTDDQIGEILYFMPFLSVEQFIAMYTLYSEKFTWSLLRKLSTIHCSIKAYENYYINRTDHKSYQLPQAD